MDSSRPKAVVVNDSRTMLHILSQMVENSGLIPIPFDGPEAALAAMNPAEPPAIVVTDVHMPGIDGWGFCRLLRSGAYPAFRDVPILVVSATFSGDEPVRIASDLGADAFLRFPVDSGQFGHTVRSILDGRQMSKVDTILIATADTAQAELLRKAFQGVGERVKVLGCCAEVRASLDEAAYEMAVLDDDLPDGAGISLVEPIRAARPECICLMLTGEKDAGRELDWMKRGVFACLRKPFDAGYLLEWCARARRERSLMRLPRLLEQRTQELHLSELRLASVLDVLQELVCRFTADGILSYVNPAFGRFFGRQIDEVTGTPFLALVPETAAEEIRRGLDALAAGHPPQTLTHAIVRHAGDEAWVEWICTAVFSAAGAVAEYQLAGRDVTDRKRTEQAVEQRMTALTQPLDDPRGIEVESLFSLDDLQRLQDELAAATGVASIITRTDGTPITKPSGFTDFCIRVREATAGRENCYQSDAHIGGQCANGPTVRRCLSGGLWDAGAGIVVGGRHIANWLIGQVRDESMNEDSVRAYAATIGVPENELVAAFRQVPAMSRERFGQVAQMLHTLAAQISGYAYQSVQQARFIHDLKRAEEQMLAANDRLATVMDSMEAVITIAEMENHELLLLNEYGRKVCGDSAEQSQWKALQGVDGDDPLCPDSLLLDADGQPALPRQWEHEDTAHKRWYEIRVCAIEWIDGRLVRMGIASDITERKLAQAEREKLEAKLIQSQKLETVGQLAGGVAHDFNNMLGVILGYTDLVTGQLEPGAALHEEMEEIRNAAERCAALTRQLLGFARKQTIVPRVLDLNKVVAEMLNMLRRLVGENIVLEWVPGKNLSQVKMDPSQIEQILVNLCVNAREAIQREGRIRLETRPLTLDEAASEENEDAYPGDYIDLLVQDNGRGMDAEILSHIFEPFFSTKDLSLGAGLGLPTVYGIVKQNNGFVRVDSQPGQGTCVHIHFPCHVAKAEPEEELDSPAAFKAVNETVLLVEDDAALLSMTQNMLKRRGYRVLAAATPGEARRLAEEHPGEVDLLMTDMVMPEMGGHELAEQLLGLQPGLKRLYMSGHTAETLVQRGVLGQGGHFIQKPFSMKELVNGVIQALSDRDQG